MLDEALLEDPRALAEADGAGLLRSAATAGAQIRSSAHAADEAGVATLEGMRPRALVLLRRPGPARHAAELAEALLGPACPVPLVVADEAPSWIGPLDVLVAHTADPADRELADSIGRAVRRGCEVVLSAPPEGPVTAAGAGGARLLEPRVPVPPGLDFPRALATVLVTVRALGLLAVDTDELAADLDAECERDHLSHEPFVNPAKALALRLADHTPLLWGVDPAGTAVAGHARATLAAHAAVIAYAADVTEAARASALQRALLAPGRADIFHDPFEDGPAPAGGALPAPPRIVLLATEDGDPLATTLRRAGREWASADTLHPSEEVPPGPRAALRRAALMAARFDLAALYLGLALGVLGSGDPGDDPDAEPRADARQLSGPA